ncbi:hypothetical protein [uncultured Desulfovibrio sp.]|uniref:hypothetical protein n=1 Tax=uncultured Desulfovibrio sp. TaxID=167968 RepID=UPI00261D60C0|nr:hypothetical protein [uncultured Desulfovibrio sp.]
MKKFFLLCGICLGLILTACGSDDEDKDKAGKIAGESTPVTPAAEPSASPCPTPGAVETDPPPSASLPPATPEEKAQADRMVDFYNTAAATLSGGWYGLPDVLLNNVRAYLGDWRLAARPAVRGARGDAAHGLAPAKGLFPAEVEAQLAQWVRDMDNALDAILADYKALDRYVKDDSIIDDGAMGRKLAKSLGASHAVFIAARDSYLKIVKARAAQAEEVLLRGHPLQRQIVAAEETFSLFRKAAGLLGPEKLDKEALEKLRQRLESVLAKAGRPPFPASPELERNYRAFLKEAALFPQGLARGLAEGFYSPLRRDLNNIAARSRDAYNAFARAANQPQFFHGKRVLCPGNRQ